MFKHVLVPLDGAELTPRAIDAGVALARQLGAAVTGFVAEAPLPLPSLGAYSTAQGPAATATPSVEELRGDEHAQRLLQGFRAAAERAGVAFDGHYQHTGDIDGAIVRAAEQHGSDLILMVTHGRGAVGRAIFGSHTPQVVARSPLPVLVMHDVPEKAVRFERLLVAVDGSALAEHAMQAGIELALQLGASITAFIAEPPSQPPPPGYGALRYVREMEAHEQATTRHADGVLIDFERRAAAAGVPFKGIHVMAELVDRAIAEAAQEQGCDMIVMATHGREGFGALLYGSQTKGVMVRSKLPLLVLH